MVLYVNHEKNLEAEYLMTLFTISDVLQDRLHIKSHYSR